MPVTECLYAIAVDASNLSEALFASDLANPDWEGRDSDWPIFVPCGLRSLWPTMAFETRLAVYLTALSASENTSRS